ncbi:MAG TPA: M48 family metallopeptidase [Cyclobacteriaceae bacterium]|jgi:predicted Zn-dependent protease|nr:M48 family metallopeptidase [Cyclobacteriaceae bacterium]
MKRNTIIVFVLAVYLFSCATVAVTGRKQMNLVSNEEIITMSSTEYQKVLATSKLSTNAEQTAMVKRVGQKIQTAVERYMSLQGKSAELTGFNWEFNLIQDDKTVNAWCMPGGKVAFYSAIMPICKDEEGVAVVMGHEVAHAIANHGRERMSQQMAAQFGMNTISLLMGQNPTGGQQLLMQAIGAGTSIGMLKFSREHESEADHIGLIFMAMAGYDPNSAPKFWERMVSMSGGDQPPEFLSTHPSHETRIKDLEGWIPEAQQYSKK